MRISTLVLTFVSLAAFGVSARAAAQASAQAQPDERKGFQQKVQADLDDMNAKINALEAKSAKSGAKTRQELKAQIKKLKADMVVVKRKLKKAEKASANAWQTMKDDTEKGVDGLKAAYQKVADKFQ